MLDRFFLRCYYIVKLNCFTVYEQNFFYAAVGYL